MMVQNIQKKACEHESEIVSYIYDELPASARELFELHLADCVECTDEFAAISYARYSVFEYQREAFANLPTPNIAIPYAPARQARPARIADGLFAGIAELLTGWRVSFAAGVLLMIVAGSFALYYLNTGRQNLANIPTIEDPTLPSAAIPPDQELVAPQNPPQVSIPATMSYTARPAATRVSLSKHVTRPPSKTDRINDRQDMAVRSAPVAPPAKAPVLGSYDESDDRSLRLSDLFDNEVGVR